MCLEVGHRREEEVGTSIPKDLVRERTGVYGDGEDSGSMSCLYAERSVLDDQSFIGVNARFLKCHEIGFGVWLSVFYIESSHHEMCLEDSWEIMVQTVEQGGLSRTGDYHGEESPVLDLIEHFQGTWHAFSFRTFVELFCFGLVDGLDFFFRSIMSAFPLADDVDGGCTGTSFVQISFFPAQTEAEAFHDGVPGFGMVRHGVEQDAVHVEQYSFQGKRLVSVIFQIILNGFLIHTSSMRFSGLSCLVWTLDRANGYKINHK